MRILESPSDMIKNRLLYEECTKKLVDLNQEKIRKLIEEGAEPIYFDIKGQICLHAIAEAGLIKIRNILERRLLC